MNGDKSKKRTKSQKSKEPKKAKTDDEMVTVEVVQSSELNEAMNHIFSLSDNGKSTGEKLLQSMEKIGAMEESLNEEAKKQARFRHASRHDCDPGLVGKDLRSSGSAKQYGPRTGYTTAI